jgi:K+ transporter
LKRHNMQSTAKKAALPAMTLAALGVVFGDIGTSPLYAIRQCFVTGHVDISEGSILGILSPDLLVHEPDHQF